MVRVREVFGRIACCAHVFGKKASKARRKIRISHLLVFKSYEILASGFFVFLGPELLMHLAFKSNVRSQ